MKGCRLNTMGYLDFSVITNINQIGWGIYFFVSLILVEIMARLDINIFFYNNPKMKPQNGVTALPGRDLTAMDRRL